MTLAATSLYSVGLSINSTDILGPFTPLEVVESEVYTWQNPNAEDLVNQSWIDLLIAIWV